MGPENPNFEERGNTVKKSLLLLACIVVLALGAAAQENLNFSTFPLINTPMPTPNGYGQLNWTNVFYVDPYEWSGGGSGFRQGPVNKDVAFVSGEDCLPLQNTCFGMVTSLVAARLSSRSAPSWLEALVPPTSPSPPTTTVST